jgi:hypothetical protein
MTTPFPVGITSDNQQALTTLFKANPNLYEGAVDFFNRNGGYGTFRSSSNFVGALNELLLTKPESILNTLTPAERLAHAALDHVNPALAKEIEGRLGVKGIGSKGLFATSAEFIDSMQTLTRANAGGWSLLFAKDAGERFLQGSALGTTGVLTAFLSDKIMPVAKGLFHVVTSPVALLDWFSHIGKPAAAGSHLFGTVANVAADSAGTLLSVGGHLGGMGLGVVGLGALGLSALHLVQAGATKAWPALKPGATQTASILQQAFRPQLRL